jgi:hypothetical protein
MSRKWLLLALLALPLTASAKDKKQQESEPPPQFLNDEGRAMDWLRRNFPETYQTFREMEERYPREFQRQFNTMIEPFTRNVPSDKVSEDLNNKIVKARFEARQLEDQFRQTDDEKKKSETKDKLKAKLNELFDLQLSLEQHDIDQMKKEQTRLEQKVDKNKQNKDAIVQRHLDEMTGGGEEFGW